MFGGEHVVPRAVVLMSMVMLPAFAREAPGDAPFIAPPGLIGVHRSPDHVDVYYDADPAMGRLKAGDVSDLMGPEGSFPELEAARSRLVCESGTYRAVVDLRRPAMTSLAVGNIPNVLGDDGVYIEAEDADGVIYSSRNAPRGARQNTWRAGLYYYDAHLLDVVLADDTGNVLDVAGELVFNCFPDKMNVEAFLVPTSGAARIVRAGLVCDVSGSAAIGEEAYIVERGGAVTGIAHGRRDGRTVRASITVDGWADGERRGTYLAFFPGSKKDDDIILARAVTESTPLPPEAFTVTGGVYGGYDRGRGVYVIHGVPGLSARNGFEGFWNNPRMYLRAGVGIVNDDRPRRIYIMHDNPAGAVEAGVLTDDFGFPLPVPVQACKNFAGENEEPDDTPFNETYYPVDLPPDGSRTFHSLHLHQNWGDHALRQVSSIRFFQIYYHLSQGVTETTCFSLPTKFGVTPSGEPRAYTLADYRPLSGQTWIGQPQHHHVALQGWLQYLDGDGCWQFPRYRGSTLLSVGPNLAWFVLYYESSDGRVDGAVEVIEMPQDDETRTFLRIRYDFREPVTVGGDPRHTFRLLNKGSYIRRVYWRELAWLDEGGEVRTAPLTYDGAWSAEGEPLRQVNSFFCAYPHVDGNDALVLRGVRGEVNGRPFHRVGFSAFGHREDRKTELMLVPLIDGDTVEAGSWMELDLMLLPYGDDGSTSMTPLEESVRFGLNGRELLEFMPEDRLPDEDMPVFGPDVAVSHGERRRDMPPMVRADDGWADFTLKGGHDRMSVVVTGLPMGALPMLWDGDAFIDQQGVGGDGLQVVGNDDGTCAAVFAPRTRTTRVGGSWATTTHRYLVGTAASSAGITGVSSLNGEVELTAGGAGGIAVTSPRIWCPAVNEREAGTPVGTARTVESAMTTVPVTVGGDFSRAVVVLERYTPRSVVSRITADRAVTLALGGLVFNGSYRLTVGRDAREVTADGSGSIVVTTPPGVEVTVTLEALR